MAEIDEEVLRKGGVCVTREKRADGEVVVVEIAREKALNALSSDTFHAFDAILDTLCLTQPTQLLFVGRGRAFSAGGDIRALRATVLQAGGEGTAERRAAAEKVLSIEYDCLLRLHRLSSDATSRVETIALSDGFTFGAGHGLFQACRTRLVTPRAVIAMPECRIGLVPDCAASHFYTRLPGSLGMFAALTGYRFAAADALALRLATAAAPPGWRGASLTGVHHGVTFPATLPHCDASAVADADSAIRRGIDSCFSRENVAAVRAAVVAVAAAGDQPWAVEAADALEAASPTALARTFAVMREGYARSDGVVCAFDRELDADATLSAGADFAEGVRAALVDKDGKPVWQVYEEEDDSK